MIFNISFAHDRVTQSFDLAYSIPYVYGGPMTEQTLRLHISNHTLIDWVIRSRRY